jgi:signal transduction histidine kinase
VLLSTVVAAVVGGLLVAGALVAARQDARHNAERVARQVSAAVVVPLSRHDFTRPAGERDMAAREDINRDLAPFLTSGMVQRVKIWTLHDGRAAIAYSDEPRLEGERPGFDPSGLVRPGEVLVHPVPDDHEHRFEAARASMLLETFVEFRMASGERAWLELYVPTDVAGEAEQLTSAALPLLLGGLALLALGTLPLSIGLARRVERERAEQRAARRYGLASAESTRLELARRLHNGVIPDLSGARLLLEMARDRDPGSSTDELLDRAHGLLTDEIRELRAILNGLVPADVDGVPLLDELAARLRREAGDGAPPIEVTVTLDSGDGGGSAPPREIGVLLHWVAEELLRNALRHARADHVRVELTGSAGTGTRLVVSDDGIGLTGPADGSRRAEGVGLQLARRVVEDHRGRLTVTAGAGTGTTVEVTLPPTGRATTERPARAATQRSAARNR